MIKKQRQISGENAEVIVKEEHVAEAFRDTQISVTSPEGQNVTVKAFEGGTIQVWRNGGYVFSMNGKGEVENAQN